VAYVGARLGALPYNSAVNRTAAIDEPPLMREIAAEVEQWLSARLELANLPANLLDAVRYAVLGGGKRLRPVVTILACEAAGGRPSDALPAAAALELIHCFSLVHDDLPAMDDDNLRRGRPTLHVHAGEAMAILAGDAMMSLAFEIIATSPMPEARANVLSAELARSTTAMIAGQVYDTLGGFVPDLSDEQKLLLIHRNKTGALIRAGCRMGAICGDASAAALNLLTRYGEHVGLMFQIVDDVLDVTQTAEQLGKASNKDQDAGKLTFPGLLGVERSRAEIEKFGDAAIEAIAPLGPAAAPLADLCRYMAVRTR
jgi:geranylgeranyl diphosphate synthase, type II